MSEPAPFGSTESGPFGGAEAVPSSILFTAGTMIGGRYRIEDVVGTGGFSIVYRAWDVELALQVALKVLRSDRWDASSLERFRREARIAREAAGPRLVRVYDIGRAEQTLYLPMELVDGETLKARLSRDRLPVEDAIAIGTQILQALQDLHQIGIVHRDVKPSNVLLGSDGTVKLADFGLAFRIDDSGTRLTRTNALIGTVEYLSPEQALGDRVDERSDLYSFGVVLYEMLAGSLPYQRQSSLGTLVARLDGEPRDVRRIRNEVPPWLARLVARLLERDRELRYPACATVLHDLARRRTPRFRVRARLVPLVGAVLAALLVTSTALLLSRESSPRFARLSRTPNGITASDEHGRVLWSKPTINGPYSIVARLQPSAGPSVVAILADADKHDSAALHRLSILDPDSGNLVSEVELPSGARFFPGFSDRYGAAVDAVDLDGDGGDEIVISYAHDPHWPSYIVLYEPRIGRSRLLFVGSGHHYYSGARDLDGDGRKELVLLGINNLMGWYRAITAVPVRPWVNTETDGALGAPVLTPDRNHMRSARTDPLWYALLPSGLCSQPTRCVDVGRADDDPIRVEFEDGASIALGKDGLLIDSIGGSRSVRIDARVQSYRRLQEAERLRSAGFVADGLLEIDRAVSAAEASKDGILLEWARRARARMLVAQGERERADSEFEALVTSSERSSIAFDAAKAFHLSGDLETAVKWYRAGMGPGGSFARGRVKNEYLRGLVLALGELRRWREVPFEVERFGATYPDQAKEGMVLLELARWRSGDVPEVDRLQIGTSSNDFDRYLMLEFRFARGESGEEVLVDVRRELSMSSETIPLLLSLEAEIAGALGRRAEAAATAVRAHARAEAERRESLVVRGMYDVVSDRRNRLS